MIEPDPTIARIDQGMELHHYRGEREAARRLFTQIWEDISGEQADPCTAAYSPMRWPTCKTTCARSWSGTSGRLRLPIWSPMRG
jgi:hypothetical protein